MSDHFDIAVIGAGPAGLMAAQSALTAQPGVRLVLVDKNGPHAGTVACAEGVGKIGFHSAIDVQPAWIRLIIDKAMFHAPNGATIRYADRNKGYIIDRARMQNDLRAWCSEHGAAALGNRRATAVSVRNKKGTRTIAFDDGGRLEANVVIDCSGPLSTFGKNELPTVKAPDLEVACFVHVQDKTDTKDMVHLYVGESLAPGGYAWAFPRDEHNMNVGLLVGSAFRGAVNIRRLLADFVRSRYGAIDPGRIYAGTIPCSGAKPTRAVPGLLKAGDAASTVNPISRAGIVEAMISGSLAGKTAAAMLGAQTEAQARKCCGNLDKAWNERLGKKHKKLARAKASLAKIPDSDYNNAADALSGASPDELTMSRIFRVSLGRFPRLAWSMRRLM